MKTGVKTAAAITAALMMATGAGAHRGHGGILAALAGWPASHYTPAIFTRQVLRAEGDPLTSCDMRALAGWQAAEGDWAAGHAWWHNPLNSTLPIPGSWPVNSDGVQAYPTWRAGVIATVRTLNLPAYTQIRAALAAGQNAQAVADAVAASPWGTGPFTAGC